MAYDEAFRRVEQEFKHLNDQLAAGQITNEQFDAALKELMVQDAQGRYWTIGVKSRKWYVNDGTQWIEARPPHESASTAPADSTPPPPAWALPIQPTAPPPPKRRSRLWFVIGVVVVILVLCICAACVTSGSLGTILSNLIRLLGNG